MKRRGSWVVPLLITVVLLSYLGYIVSRGLGTGTGPFFRTEVAPGVFGIVVEPPSRSVPATGFVVLPRTAGWDPDQAERVTTLAGQGAVVVVLDYYRGGRDSYHGSPNEVSDELWSHWKANLGTGLAWVDAHRRGLPWTILSPLGRAADLVRALAPENFAVRVDP
jgi:hypothetical protein